MPVPFPTLAGICRFFAFGVGGGTAAAELEAEGTKDVGWLIAQAEQALDAGADIIMIESEGITENVTTWRTDVVARIINKLGLEKVMFEGADPSVFEWYIKNYGNEREFIRGSFADRAA